MRLALCRGPESAQHGVMAYNKGFVFGALIGSLIASGCARQHSGGTTLEAAVQSAPQVRIEGSSLVLIEDASSSALAIYFAVDSDAVAPESYAALDALVAFLDSHGSSMRVVVQGHADERGPDTYNASLSLRRAKAVKRYLVERGIDPHMLETVGFGERRPEVRDSADRRNRRVEFVLGHDPKPLAHATTTAH